jgi:hypothetical protein
MSWDFAIEPRSGDFIFSGSGDIMSVEAEALDSQRVGIRLRIHRGTFVYDEEDALGSNLHTALRYSVERAQNEIPAIVNEALEPMRDIKVMDVQVAISEDDPSQIATVVRFQKNLSAVDADELDDDIEELTVVVPLSGGGF